MPFQMVFFSKRDVTFLAFKFTKPAVVVLHMFAKITFISKKQMAEVTIHFQVGPIDMDTHLVHGISVEPTVQTLMILW